MAGFGRAAGDLGKTSDGSTKTITHDHFSDLGNLSDSIFKQVCIDSDAGAFFLGRLRSSFGTDN